MGIQTTLGAYLEIAPTTPSTLDQAGFEAITGWVEVGEISDFGSAIGATFEDVTHQPVKTGITKHRKGGIDYGTCTITCARDDEDAGQQAVDSGVDGDNKLLEHSIRITLGNGAVRYFTGSLFSNTESYGNASAMITTEVNIMLSSGVIKVSA